MSVAIGMGKSAIPIFSEKKSKHLIQQSRHTISRMIVDIYRRNLRGHGVKPSIMIRGLNTITPGVVAVILKAYFSNSLYRIAGWALLKLLSYDCHRS